LASLMQMGSKVQKMLTLKDRVKSAFMADKKTD
jgi:hypothetical protein